MPNLVTVYCGACAGPLQVSAAVLNQCEVLVFVDCPRCGTNVQVNG